MRRISSCEMGENEDEGGEWDTNRVKSLVEGMKENTTMKNPLELPKLNNSIYDEMANYVLTPSVTNQKLSSDQGFRSERNYSFPGVVDEDDKSFSKQPEILKKNTLSILNLHDKETQKENLPEYSVFDDKYRDKGVVPNGDPNGSIEVTNQ